MKELFKCPLFIRCYRKFLLNPDPCDGSPTYAQKLRNMLFCTILAPVLLASKTPLFTQ